MHTSVLVHHGYSVAREAGVYYGLRIARYL
jgi:hypothetical protein